MELDDELCLCFHVTKRKVINYLRVERPLRVGQLSDCFGAGTGCGWCRSYLAKLFREANWGGAAGPGARPAPAAAKPDLSQAEYARQRAAYIRQGGGTPPPGATPIDLES